jgi:hypothetical protein
MRGELVEVELVDHQTGQQHDRGRAQEQDVQDVPGASVLPARSLFSHSPCDIPALEASDGKSGQQEMLVTATRLAGNGRPFRSGSVPEYW